MIDSFLGGLLPGAQKSHLQRFPRLAGLIWLVRPGIPGPVMHLSNETNDGC